MREIRLAKNRTNHICALAYVTPGGAPVAGLLLQGEGEDQGSPDGLEPLLGAGHHVLQCNALATWGNSID
jgi:hypothetical protein